MFVDKNKLKMWDFRVILQFFGLFREDLLGYWELFGKGRVYILELGEYRGFLRFYMVGMLYVGQKYQIERRKMGFSLLIFMKLGIIDIVTQRE